MRHVSGRIVVLAETIITNRLKVKIVKAEKGVGKMISATKELVTKQELALHRLNFARDAVSQLKEKVLHLRNNNNIANMLEVLFEESQYRLLSAQLAYSEANYAESFGEAILTITLVENVERLLSF